MASKQSQSTHSQQSKSGSKWLLVIILAVAQFVMVLDSTVMNVSISTVVKDLNTTVSAMQTAITFYTLTMAAFMLTGAKLNSKWGLLKAFSIGSVVYGIGSLLTALSPNITTLFLGWSVIEGLGAVLVIPAIAALIAVTYSGKDRVFAYAVIGGISGAAAAAGPLIGGFMTTYLSWRYVFAAETVIMIFVLFAVRKYFTASSKTSKQRLDLLSVALSASGLTLIVYGMLQSKVWGWIEPMAVPQIAGHPIAPFGISIVPYLIISGIIVIKLFMNRQATLEAKGGNPLLQVSMMKNGQLRAGLSVLTSQYVTIAAIFFIIPIYLQMVIGLDALQTGIRILPLSIALIVFSMAGSRAINRWTPRQIVRTGQVVIVFGSFALLAAIQPGLTGIAFSSSMFLVGAGLGLLASQLGNVNMSAVSTDLSSEVGGVSGTFQNLGSSLGTALIGSVLVANLTSGFVSGVNASSLPTEMKTYVTNNSQAGVSIVPVSQVSAHAQAQGVPADQADQLGTIYESAQLEGLKHAVFFLIVLATLSLLLSRNIPNKKVA